eukprot:703763-Pleurochrysis_carterae.AAC.1
MLGLNGNNCRWLYLLLVLSGCRAPAGLGGDSGGPAALRWLLAAARAGAYTAQRSSDIEQGALPGGVFSCLAPRGKAAKLRV